MNNRYGAIPNMKGITIGDTPYIAVPVAYLAELLNAVYGDAALSHLDGDPTVALWIADGAPEYGGFSEAALDEAAAMNCYDLANEERE